MSDATSVLFGLEDEFRSLRSSGSTPRGEVDHRADDREGPCPACGVLLGGGEGSAADAAEGPAGVGSVGRAVVAQAPAGVSRRRCAQKTFTQVSAAVRPRARVTERLRQRVATAIASGQPGRLARSPASTGCPGRPRTRRSSRPRRSGCRSRSRRAGWGSMRPASGRCAGSWTGSSGSGPIHG